MKTKMLLCLLGALALLGCNKEENDSGGFPKTYSLYFEILDNQGNLLEDGRAEISSHLKLENGVLIPEGSPDIYWNELGKFTDDSYNLFLLGIPCGGPNCTTDYAEMTFASGAEGNSNTNNTQTWVKDKYFLFRYQDNEVDTLRINDVRKYEPYERIFTFYVNGQQWKVESLSVVDYKLSIQK